MVCGSEQGKRPLGPSLNWMLCTTSAGPWRTELPCKQERGGGVSGMGGEGRGLKLSTRAEREMKGDESVDQGSFTPSRYTSSRGTSQVNGYTCYNYKRVTPYQKGTPHTSFGESGGAGNQYRYAQIGTQVKLSSDTPLSISPILNIPAFPPTCIESLCSIKVYIGKVS